MNAGEESLLGKDRWWAGGAWGRKPSQRQLQRPSKDQRGRLPGPSFEVFMHLSLRLRAALSAYPRCPAPRAEVPERKELPEGREAHGGRLGARSKIMRSQGVKRWSLGDPLVARWRERRLKRWAGRRPLGLLVPAGGGGGGEGYALEFQGHDDSGHIQGWRESEGYRRTKARGPQAVYTGHAHRHTDLCVDSVKA